MSRLVYDSNSSEDVDDCDDDVSDVDGVMDAVFEREEELALSSYTLHDIDFTPHSSSRSASSTKKQREGGQSVTCGKEVIDLTQENSNQLSDEKAVNPLGTSANDSGGSRSIENNDANNGLKHSGISSLVPSSAANTAKTAPTSSLRPSSRWLSSFLSTTRSTATPPPPPPNSPLRTDFLQLFDQSSKHHAPARRGQQITDDADDESVDVDIGGERDVDTDEEGAVCRGENRDNTLTGEDRLIHLFNLPYTISAEQIKKTARMFGVLLSDVTLKKDATGRPAGSAVATCDSLVSMSTGMPFESEEEEEGEERGGKDLAEMCAFLLADKSFGARPVRVQTTQAMHVERDRRRQDNLASGSGRYFGVGQDISVKCHSCGQVGHRQQECLEEERVMNPCHLCASTRHDAANCHNIVCFQCNSFGHHSRDCPKKRGSGYYSGRTMLCTLCGGSNHERRRCRQPSAMAKKNVEGPEETLECMCCGKFGHAMCLRVPAVRSETDDGDLNIFCPKCGEVGHHADLVVNEMQEPSCRQPHFSVKRRKLDSQPSQPLSTGGGDSRNKHSAHRSDNGDRSGGGKEGKDRNWRNFKDNRGGGGGGGGRKVFGRGGGGGSRGGGQHTRYA